MRGQGRQRGACVEAPSPAGSHVPTAQAWPVAGGECSHWPHWLCLGGIIFPTGTTNKEVYVYVFLKIFIYLFIWLHWVLVAAHGIF